MRITGICLFCVIAVIVCCGTGLAETAVLPDLVVESVDFVPVPKEYGFLDAIKITVTNQGKADAAKCTLSLSCAVTKCNAGNDCEGVSSLVRGDMPVPAIKKGERISLEWTPASAIRWAPGKYSVAADIDKYNAVQEANEENNITKSAIWVKSLSPRVAAER